MGYNPWGREESDMTDRLHFHALEKEMATYSSVLPGESRDGGAWWTAVYGVPQSWTRLKQLNSSSNCPQNTICSYFFPIQDPTKDTALHVVVMALQSSIIQSIFPIFLLSVRSLTFSCRMSHNLNFYICFLIIRFRINIFPRIYHRL